MSTGADFTVLRANFQPSGVARWTSAECVGVRVTEGHEPASLPAGRVDVWVASGAVIGHVDHRPPGTYQAQVRGALAPGTRVAARIAGSTSVPAHRFSVAVPVPTSVRRTSPAAGFRLRSGEDLRVSWQGGDSSHVAILVMVAHGEPDTSPAAWMLSCVVPRAPGGFTVPGRALARGLVPADADTVTLAVTADGRVTEDEYGLDVTPVGTGDDLVPGVFIP